MEAELNLSKCLKNMVSTSLDSLSCGILQPLLLNCWVPWYYLHDKVDVGGEGLDSVEAGDEGDGEEALHIHLPPQEEVPLQVVEAEVVLTGRERQHGTLMVHQHLRLSLD